MHIFSIGGGLTDGSYEYDYARIYNIMKAQAEKEKIKIDYHIMNAYSKSGSIDGIEWEVPDKQKFIEYFRNGLDEYELIVISLSGHGAESGYIRCFKDNTISSKELANIINESSNNARVVIILDCCHAAAIVPFKANLTMQEKNENELASIDMANTFIDDLFDNLNDTNQIYGFAASEQPKVLSWCACNKSQTTGMGNEGGYFLTRISKYVDVNQTYSQAFEAVHKKYTTAVKKSKNFDESIPVFV